MSILTAAPQPTCKSLSAIALESTALAHAFGFPKGKSNEISGAKSFILTAVVSKVVNVNILWPPPELPDYPNQWD